MRIPLLVLASLLAVACSPAAPSSPTAAPTTAAKPAAAASPAVAGSPGAAASPAAGLPGIAPAAAKPGSGPSDTQVASVIDGYYQKAKASGETKLAIYGGVGPDWDGVINAFKKKFSGIDMESVNLRGPEMIQRLQAEAASGRYVANLVTHGQTTMSTIDAAGVLTDWDGPPTAPIIPPAALTEGRTRWSSSVNLFSAIANTSLIPPDKMPNSRQMLLDPFFKGKGKLLIEDPRGGGPGLDVFTINYVQLGQPFLDGIKAQESTFVRDRDNAPAQIARGEYALFYPVSITSELFDLEKAAPVKVIYLTDGGTSIQESTIGVVKDAPGQDSAKLFVSWLLSEEGQRLVVSERQTYASMPGLPPPSGQPPIEDVHPSKRTSDQIKRNNEFIDIFDKAFFQ